MRDGPTLNRSSALQWFERSNTIEIHSGIMFDFYTQNCHIYIQANYFQFNAQQTWGVQIAEGFG